MLKLTAEERQSAIAGLLYQGLWLQAFKISDSTKEFYEGVDLILEEGDQEEIEISFDNLGQILISKNIESEPTQIKGKPPSPNDVSSQEQQAIEAGKIGEKSANPHMDTGTRKAPKSHHGKKGTSDRSAAAHKAVATRNANRETKKVQLKTHQNGVKKKYKWWGDNPANAERLAKFREENSKTSLKMHKKRGHMIHQKRA